MKEKKQKYYTADPDKLKKKLEQIGSGTYFKPKEGKNIIRILPPWSDSGLWYKEATLHYGLNDDSGRERGFPCLKMFKKECPVCNKREELMEGTGEDKKIADRIRARTKFYANVLDRATGQVKIWGFSQKTLGILLSYSGDPDYGELSNPDEGYDVVVERTGTTKMDTRYQVRVKPKPSEVDMDEITLHNLDTVVVEDMEEDDLEEIVESNFGRSKKREEDDEDEDEEEEEAPKKKKKVVEEDEDEDDEEDEEEEKPKKKKKSSKDDDEEDEEDDEDEEEEPKSKKKKKSEEDDEDEDDDDEEDE